MQWMVRTMCKISQSISLVPTVRQAGAQGARIRSRYAPFGFQVPTMFSGSMSTVMSVEACSCNLLDGTCRPVDGIRPRNKMRSVLGCLLLVRRLPCQFSQDVRFSVERPLNVRLCLTITSGVPRGMMMGAIARTKKTRDRKSTRLNSSHSGESRMPSSA